MSDKKNAEIAVNEGFTAFVNRDVLSEVMADDMTMMLLKEWCDANRPELPQSQCAKYAQQDQRSHRCSQLHQSAGRLTYPVTQFFTDRTARVAFYCCDEVMMDTYRKNGDIHATTTSFIFGVSYEEAQDIINKPKDFLKNILV